MYNKCTILTILILVGMPVYRNIMLDRRGNLMSFIKRFEKRNFLLPQKRYLFYVKRCHRFCLLKHCYQA